MTDPIDEDATKQIPVIVPGGTYQGANANDSTAVHSNGTGLRTGRSDYRGAHTDPGGDRESPYALAAVRDLPGVRPVRDWTSDSQWGGPENQRVDPASGDSTRGIRAHRDPAGKQRPRPGFLPWLAGFAVAVLVPMVLFPVQLYALPAVGLKALPLVGYLYVAYVLCGAGWLWGTAVDWRRGKI